VAGRATLGEGCCKEAAPAGSVKKRPKSTAVDRFFRAWQCGTCCDWPSAEERRHWFVMSVCQNLIVFVLFYLTIIC
jgi:hypothetical protein